MKKILFLKGGASTEHEVSLRSAQYLTSQIDPALFKVIEVFIDKEGQWNYQDEPVYFTSTNELVTKNERINIDYAIPCIHGYPGETGHLQAMFEMQNLPFLGEGFEQSLTCFNKILTKLVLDKNEVHTAPFIFVNNSSEKSISKIEHFFDTHKDLFFKASNQGSSVGCYHLESKELIKETLDKCFQFSSQVIIEKKIKMRELEVSVFNYKEQTHATPPCEIISAGDFYDYEQKYSANSKTTTQLHAKIPKEIIELTQHQATMAFSALGLKEFCRMDFFYDESSNEVFLNEVNTFPGLTKISMFPKMIESYGVNFKDFLNSKLPR